ncbi:alpha-glucan phosphorylase, partial [Patescibacteria group bacterium]|nr:alpha-glucan phosphorylase [Patescibacteria group bacterium]
MMEKDLPLVAYFCAEFGLESRLPIYAGGLGVLSGDTLKEAADQKLPMVGIGLLYHGEGAKQIVNLEGEQQEVDVPFDELSV